MVRLAVPGGAVQDLVAPVNGRKPRRFISLMKYFIWIVWFGAIVVLLIRSGGPFKLAPLYMTENYVSVDEPFKFITYFGVVLILLVVALLVGRRGACHTICWMAPFMVWGMLAGDAVKIPSLHIAHKQEFCTNCGECKKTCPMSLDPVRSAKAGKPPFGCINCGECVGTCGKGPCRSEFGK
ncbi:MAG: hypothetical protein MZU95_11890 [Desulfomicrobium escambiense]|nr:hypothetical protein [Desulfomicrobium escambiense]